MELSGGERLILAMLCEIYGHLKIKNPEIDYKLVQAAIFGGDHWALKWEYPSLFSEPVDEAVVKETGDILSMWRVVEGSYKKLSKADKAKVEKDAAPFGKNPKFSGFDGNHDPHYGVAEFLVNKLGRFEELKGRALNSHTSGSLANYRRMYPKYDHIVSSAMLHDGLDADQLIEILKR